MKKCVLVIYVFCGIHVLGSGLDLKDNGELNVSMKRSVKLFSKKSNGYLQIKEERVNSRGKAESEFANLYLESVGFGKIRIKGMATRRFLCFHHETNKLVSLADGRNESCVFNMKHYKKTYKHYFSLHVNPSKYLAARKNGRITIIDIPEGKEKEVRRGTLLFYEIT